jgi:hypothetical protein
MESAPQLKYILKDFTISLEIVVSDVIIRVIYCGARKINAQCSVASG